MRMLYVCVLCASCGSSQCCIPHDLQFVNVVVPSVDEVVAVTVFVYCCLCCSVPDEGG